MTKRIFVAGHMGMVGRALVRQLELLPDTELVVIGRSELDLTDQRAVQEFLIARK